MAKKTKKPVIHKPTKTEVIKPTKIKTTKYKARHEHREREFKGYEWDQARDAFQDRWGRVGTDAEVLGLLQRWDALHIRTREYYPEMNGGLGMWKTTHESISDFAKRENYFQQALF